MVAAGIPEEQARRDCWFFDSQGLLVAGRDDIPPQKRPYAHDHDPVSDFQEAIRILKPTALIGCAGQPAVFDEDVIRLMAAEHERPIIFALSNPTAKAECTAQQAYEWSEGRAVFASGSPFDPVQLGNQTFVPGQGNNAYIFPGVGLGAVVSQSTRVTDGMFLRAAQVLAGMVTDEDLAMGRVYPGLSQIREVSAQIAAAVADMAYDEGLARREQPDDVLADAREAMFQPLYPHYA
jgi:malate dehydrogenase (oxaloacetate-decarboxylating)(NADP+)